MRSWSCLTSAAGTVACACLLVGELAAQVPVDAASREAWNVSNEVYTNLQNAFSEGGKDFLTYAVAYKSAAEDLDRFLAERPLDWEKIADGCDRIAFALGNFEPTLKKIDMSGFGEIYNRSHTQIDEQLQTQKSNLEEHKKILAEIEAKATPLTAEDQARKTRASVGLQSSNTQIEYHDRALKTLISFNDAFKQRNIAVEQTLRAYGHIADAYRDVAQTIRVVQDARKLEEMLETIATQSKSVMAIVRKAQAQLTDALDKLANDLVHKDTQ